VNTVLTGLDAAIALLRIAFLAVAVLLAVAAVVDWLVRTRRLNPFGYVGRFFRRVVDPVFSPVERRVVRAGGLPSSAPWWALAAVVIAGVIILSLLGFLRGAVFDVFRAYEAGPRGMLRFLITWIFQILQIAILVRVITSWVGVSPYSRWVRWAYSLSEPILRPLRSFIPNLGMIDITPIVAFFGLRILQVLVLSLI
jgi:YggT family protein